MVPMYYVFSALSSSKLLECTEAALSAQLEEYFKTAQQDKRNDKLLHPNIYLQLGERLHAL